VASAFSWFSLIFLKVVEKHGITFEGICAVIQLSVSTCVPSVHFAVASCIILCELLATGQAISLLETAVISRRTYRPMTMTNLDQLDVPLSLLPDTVIVVNLRFSKNLADN